MGKQSKVLPMAGCILAGLVVAALFGASAASASARATPHWMTAFQHRVDAAYAGRGLAVPAKGPKAQKGKHVWFVACRLEVRACAEMADGVREASAAIGWDLTVRDSKNDPTLASQHIRDAIAAKADGIAVAGVDCPMIKDALQDAKAAHIPVVNMGNLECQPALFTAHTTTVGKPWLDGITQFAVKDRAAWAVVKTGGRMKAINVAVTDVGAIVMQDQAFRDAVAECPTCQIVDTISVPIRQYSQLGTMLADALQRHPEANAVNMPGLSAEMKAAVEQSGRKDLTLIPQVCRPETIAMIRAGWNMQCTGVSLDWGGWMTVDLLNRLLAGQRPDQLPRVGAGIEFVDAQHNLPKQDAWLPSFDFRKAYEKVWQ